MSVAATMVRPGVKAQRVDDLVRALKVFGLHGVNRRPWVSIDRIASALGVEPGKLAVPLASAESDGLAVIRRTEAGRISVRLTRLAAPRLVVRREPRILNEIEASPHRELILVIASMPTTSPTIDDLAETLGRGQDELCRELVEASGAGLVDLWPESPAGPAVVLSVLSAERLGLVISSDYSTWLRVGEPDWCDEDHSREVRAADFDTRLEASRFFAGVEDPADPPEVQAMEAEDVEARAAELAKVELPDVIPMSAKPQKPEKRGRWSSDRIMSILEGECLDGSEELRIPRPVKFLGYGRQWPVMVEGSSPPRPWTPKEGPCPVCGGLPLDTRTTCLICAAAGIDPLLAMIRTPCPAPDHVPAGADSVRTQALRGGI